MIDTTYACHLENIKKIAEYYIRAGYVVERCSECGKLTKFDCPPRVEATNGPSLSSEMWCDCIDLTDLGFS